MNFWLRTAGALVVLLASFWQPAQYSVVSAQSGAKARITRLDASSFPTVRLIADVLREDGSFVSGLQPSDIKVLENNVQHPVDEVLETANGVGLVVAVNGGPILANRITAKTHLQIIKDALLAWVPEAETLDKGDNVTLVTNAGAKAINLVTPEEWSAAFNTLSTDLTLAVPSLTSLTTAVEQSGSAPLRPGMKKSILYITPLVSTGLTKALENITDQAAGEGVQVNVWLVAQGAAGDSQSEQAINALAERTGGQVYRFTGKEALPPIENYLQPLRRQYEILYRSRTSKSGAQTVAIEVQTESAQARSPEENFEVLIKPPNVMFVEPPQKIILAWQKNESGADILIPSTIPIKVQTEFPDKHPRNLLVTQLLVDGNMVDERNVSPYESFSWPVRNLKTSGTYSLQVTIKDELGLSARTVILPLEVEVPAPPPSRWLDTISAERLALAAGLVLLCVILIVLIRWNRVRRRVKKSPTPASARVGTRPLERKSAVFNLSRKSSESLSAQSRDTTGWLFPVDSGDAFSTQPSVPLREDVITLGSSPIRATVVIASPSVDGLHVRILRKNGGYWLEDAGSVSGTWVNRTPVSNLGTALNPGDVIRLGKITYRFELRG